MLTRILLVLLLTIVPLSSSMAHAHAETQRVQVLLEGKALTSYAPPILLNGRTLVPVEWFYEYFGAKVSPHSRDKFAVTRGQATLELKADSRTVVINGKDHEMDVPVTVKGVWTYVPLRFAIEVFG